MRILNSSENFLRVIIVSFFFTFFVLMAPQLTASAQAEAKNFDIAISSLYKIQEDGMTQVSENIRIKNMIEYIYTPSYTIILGIDEIHNVKVFDSEDQIPFEVENSDNGKKIKITFTKSVVGAGKINAFTLSFETSEIAKKRGEIWEVLISGVSDTSAVDEYSIELSVPKKFGDMQISKPQQEVKTPSITTTTYNSYFFTKNQIGKSGISILFGEAQYYSFDFTYNIENPNLFPIKTEIALPPSTNYQDVLLKNINPQPQQVYVDADGNWLALYSLPPQKKQKILATLYVKVLSKPKSDNLSKENVGGYLSNSKYWETDSPEIKRLTNELKTPQNIYSYVVKNLKYNYDKVSGENERLGAKKTLQRKDYSVCLEFTDLFVTLARASGIPARAVEGYAHTENSKLKPLSLLKDVLHAWPEYYDDNTQSWIMVDPTWGNTTHGADYFNNLDFDHVAFVIKGKSSTYPIPAGGYKLDPNSKDIKVSFIDHSKFVPNNKSEVIIAIPSRAISGFPINGKIIVRNKGNRVIRDKEVLLDSKLSSLQTKFYIDSIPPLGQKVFDLKFYKTPLFTNKVYQIKIIYDGGLLTQNIAVSILPDLGWILIGGGMSATLATLLFFTRKTWGVLIQRQKK